MEKVVDARLPGPDSCADLTNRAYDELDAGDHFVLVADHDPTGLKYMLQAERDGRVTWTPREEGPEVWRVEVGKPA